MVSSKRRLEARVFNCILISLRTDTMGTPESRQEKSQWTVASFLGSPRAVFTAAIALRIILFGYGSFQDAHSAFKYTDIDYYVFTDAARFVSRGRSPYERATYRYTPLLAWILVPTTWPGGYWFGSGKVLFAASDIVAGWLILAVLKGRGVNGER